MKRIWIVFACLLVTIGLLAIWFSNIPYDSVRGLLDYLSLDGNADTYSVHMHETFCRRLSILGVLYLVFSFCLFLIYFPVWRAYSNPNPIPYSDRQDDLIPPDTEVRFLGWCVLGVCIIAVIFRAMLLNEPLHYDEAFTFLNFSSQSIVNVLSNFSVPNNQILHSLLVYISGSTRKRVG